MSSGKGWGAFVGIPTLHYFLYDKTLCGYLPAAGQHRSLMAEDADVSDITGFRICPRCQEVKEWAND